MNCRKILYFVLAVILLFVVTACSNRAHYSELTDTPGRFAYEHVPSVRSNRVNREAGRNRPATNSGLQRPARRQSAPARSATERIIPHSTAQPHGRVVHMPDSLARHYEPGPQAMQPIPHMPEPVNIPESPHARANAGAASPSTRDNADRSTSPSTRANSGATSPPAQANSEAAKTHSRPAPAPAASSAARQELSNHKTEFNAKEEARATNITRASNSINGHIVQPGETFSYNQTVGPTIERRGYKEGTIYVQGEKKKGFGGGVCQVSSTLSVAADEAGMTIIERHDHSLPVSYAKEGEEAATSYGVIDFKFKNEKSFPVTIKSSVEGGTISVSILK